MTDNPRCKPIMTDMTEYPRLCGCFQAVLIANTAPESEAIKRALEVDSEGERVI
jgi:hypothetical protein